MLFPRISVFRDSVQDREKRANVFFIKQQLVVILYKDTSRSSLALSSNSYPHNMVLSYFAWFALIIFCKVST